jgi:cyclophilin family peptidyl-prolyl cis-trans isomerase
MKPTRPLTLCILACSLSACGTFHKVSDKTLGFFKGKPAPANVEGAVAEPLPPAAENSATAVMYVDINKSRRKVVIQLDPATAPKAVANFKKLVNAGFYNGLAFHRAIQGYLVQTGDPATRTEDTRDAWGLSDVGYKLPPEPRGRITRGAIAMARTNEAIRRGDKQSSGSQFFVMLRSDAKLDGNYTVIGHVTQGIEALEAIAAMTVDTNDCPTRRYEIKSLRLVPGSSPELKAEKQTRIKTRNSSEKGKVGRFFERLW